MTRFRKEARQVDSGKMTAVDFCREVFSGEKLDWANVWAAAAIYKEDGGQRLTAGEFKTEVMSELGCEEEPAVKALFGEFLAHPGP